MKKISNRRRQAGVVKPNKRAGDGLNQLLQKITLEVNRIIEQNIKELRQDSFDEETQSVVDLINLQVDALLKRPEIQTELERISKEAAKASVKAVSRQLGVQLTLHIEDLTQTFIERNTNLITAVSSIQLEKVKSILEEAYRNNDRHEDVAVKIEQLASLSKSKAKLIARDQMLTFNSQITRTAHQKAGISRYIWTTVGDQRVREDHQDLDGKTFSYENPPPDGNPGEPINCRCFAYPVIE